MPGTSIRLWCSGLVTLACVAIVSPTCGQEGPTKATVFKAWKQRQDRVQSARFEWTVRQTDTKGAISWAWGIENPKLKGAPPIPPKDTTFQVPYAASFSENKLRYSYTGQSWGPDDKGYAALSYLSTFDGKECRLLHGPSGTTTWHQGQVREETFHLEKHNMHLQAILLTFRARMPDLCPYHLDDFALGGGKTFVDNRPCFELTYRQRDTERTLFLDPARDWVVVRSLVTFKGKVTSQIDVRYVSDARHGWVPTTWDIIENRHGGILLRSYQARVTNYEVNPPIPATEFELEFPLGSSVYDEKTRQEYIVKPDGSGKRMIPREDRGAKREVLLRTEPGHAKKEQKSAAPWHGPALAALLLVLAGSVLFVIIRRSKFSGWKHEK